MAGGGPAGCAAAIGLSRLGYTVMLVHAPRPWPSCEGISARTCEGLRNAGLHRALATVPTASPRSASWNGVASAANSEHLVSRQVFDAALLEDAAAAGVRLLPGKLRQVTHGPDHCSVEIETASGATEALPCRFLVDARGRAAPGGGARQMRGPETVSLLQVRQGPAGEPGSRVSSFAGGWSWLATTADGLACTQLTVTADTTRLPKRHALNSWFEQTLAELASTREFDRASSPVGDVIARGSTSILQGELVTPRSLRVGDAAMAVDPLSGNGIFQSLSSALVAPAVIHTLLHHPADEALAMQFYVDRVRHGFLRFARMGRDFYRMESRWPETAFWQQRQGWPDDEPSHADTAPALLGIRTKPVVAGDRISARPVAVTSDHPLGVWHVAGIELAPLLQDLPPAAAERASLLGTRLARACAGDAGKQSLLEGWLRRYRLL